MIFPKITASPPLGSAKATLQEVQVIEEVTWLNSVCSVPHLHFTLKNFPLMFSPVYDFNSTFFIVLPERTFSCFFLQLEHSNTSFCLFPCFFTVFSPARLPPWPSKLRLCARLPSAIVLALLLLATFTLCG